MYNTNSEAEQTMQEQEIVQKIAQLDPAQKQTVYEFVDFLLSKRATLLNRQKSTLLEVSVWDELAVDAVAEAQKKINEWTLPDF